MGRGSGAREGRALRLKVEGKAESPFKGPVQRPRVNKSHPGVSQDTINEGLYPGKGGTDWDIANIKNSKQLDAMQRRIIAAFDKGLCTDKMYIAAIHALIAKGKQLEAQLSKDSKHCFLCGGIHFARNCKLAKTYDDEEFSAFRDAPEDDSPGTVLSAIDLKRLADLQSDDVSADAANNLGPVPAYVVVDEEQGHERAELQRQRAHLHQLAKAKKRSRIQNAPVVGENFSRANNSTVGKKDPDDDVDDKPPKAVIDESELEALVKELAEMPPPLPAKRAPVPKKIVLKKVPPLPSRDPRVAEVVWTDRIPPPLPVGGGRPPPRGPRLPEKVDDVPRSDLTLELAADRELKEDGKPILPAGLIPIAALGAAEGRELKDMAHKVTSVARRPTKSDLPDEGDLHVQASVFGFQPFADYAPLPIVVKTSLLSWFLLLVLIYLGVTAVENDCEYLRPSVCPSFSLISMLRGESIDSSNACRVLRYAPLDFGLFNEQISTWRPFSNMVRSHYSEWQKCQADHVLPLEIRHLLLNFSAREVFLLTCFIVYFYFMRRTTWYTPLEELNERPDYDVRDLSQMSRPVTFARPLFRKFRVTEMSGNLWVDIGLLLRGRLRREVVVSMELFVALCAVRTQLIANDGKTLRIGLVRNAELMDQLNLNRYVSALSKVHLNTVNLAYHYLMSEERHKLDLF